MAQINNYSREPYPITLPVAHLLPLTPSIAVGVAYLMGGGGGGQ